MGDQAVVDAHRTGGLAAATGRAPVEGLGHLVEVLVGEGETTEEPGFEDSGLSEVPPVYPQEKLRAMAGDVLFGPRGFVELAGGGTPAALGAETGKGVQGQVIVAVAKDCGEGLKEAPRFVSTFEALLLHVVAVFLCGSQRSVLRHSFHWN